VEFFSCWERIVALTATPHKKSLVKAFAVALAVIDFNKSLLS
jgi:hypothetical protein